MFNVISNETTLRYFRTLCSQDLHIQQGIYRGYIDMYVKSKYFMQNTTTGFSY